MKLRKKLKLAYDILTARSFYLFVVKDNGLYEQTSKDIQVMHADLIIDNLVYAANLAEKENQILTQVKNIINGISPN